MIQLKRALKHEARLRHRSLRRVNEQKDSVHHLEDTLDLASEVGVSRGVDDIYFHTVVVYGGVLRKDSDPSLAFKVARVHNALGRRLIVAVNSALFQHLVNKRCFAVVNMRYYRNVP